MLNFSTIKTTTINLNDSEIERASSITAKVCLDLKPDNNIKTLEFIVNDITYNMFGDGFVSLNVKGVHTHEFSGSSVTRYEKCAESGLMAKRESIPFMNTLSILIKFMQDGSIIIYSKDKDDIMYKHCEYKDCNLSDIYVTYNTPFTATVIAMGSETTPQRLQSLNL